MSRCDQTSTVYTPLAASCSAKRKRLSYASPQWRAEIKSLSRTATPGMSVRKVGRIALLPTPEAPVTMKRGARMTLADTCAVSESVCPALPTLVTPLVGDSGFCHSGVDARPKRARRSPAPVSCPAPPPDQQLDVLRNEALLHA